MILVIRVGRLLLLFLASEMGVLFLVFAIAHSCDGGSTGPFTYFDWIRVVQSQCVDPRTGRVMRMHDRSPAKCTRNIS